MKSIINHNIFLSNRFSSPWLAFIVIGFSVLVIYSNICNNPFVFDDVSSIVENTNIRDLSNYLFPDKLLEPRAIVDFTFALNYRFGKLDVFGYHLINILIHILNGFLVYVLVSVVLKQMSECSDASAALISGSPDFSIRITSLFAALIFVVHPIQTQAVTYTVQRYASMAAMFYMASVLFYLKARILQQGAGSKEQREKSKERGAERREQSAARNGERGEKKEDDKINILKFSSVYVLSMVCGILAFLSKQNTASLPLAILIVEYLLIDRTWQGWKTKLPWFVVLFALWTLFILYVSGFFSGGFEGRELLEDVSGLIKETEAVGRWQYLCTQFNVVVIYIRLLFLPVLQNLDYMYPFKSGFFDSYTPFAFLFLIGIVAFGLWHIKKRPMISLAIFWFFITLSVESSVIPIRDALFEHRLYLPMMGFGLFVSCQLSHYLSDKRFIAFVLSLAIVVALGAATYWRNTTWQNEKALWSDVVTKSPENYRAHNNLGNALEDHGKLSEATGHYYKALRINSDYVDAYYNLGNTFAGQGRMSEAIKYYTKALRIKPNYADAHNNLGFALACQGKISEAIKHYTEVLRTNPSHAKANYNLGNAFLQQGKMSEAIKYYKGALRINPNFTEARGNLKKVLASALLNEIDWAVKSLQGFLKVNPEDPRLHYGLGTLYYKKGEFDKAIYQYEKFLSIQPDNPSTYYNIACMYSMQGRVEKSIDFLKRAIEKGYDNWDNIRNDRYLENVRGTSHYKKLLSSY